MNRTTVNKYKNNVEELRFMTLDKSPEIRCIVTPLNSEAADAV
jgi:hypothetical protein